MKLVELDALAKGMAPVVTRLVEVAVAAAVEPLLARIAQLEAAAPAAGERGPPGEPGRDGRDGDSAPPVTADQIALAVDAWLTANRPANGLPGEPGRDGRDGASAPPVTEGQISLAVDAWLSANPPAAGAAGRDGRDGLDGKDGAPGADGVGLAGAVIDREGGLLLTLTNGVHCSLGQVVGRDGKDGARGADGADGEDGADGADGLGFEDMDLEFDGERTLVATFARGEISKAVNIEFPVILDRGVYKAEAAYVRGDSVTWGGSSWIAQRDVNAGEKPEASDAWRLAVKRGRDGRDGKDGPKGEPGAKGDPGRDGRH